MEKLHNNDENKSLNFFVQPNSSGTAPLMQDWSNAGEGTSFEVFPSSSYLQDKSSACKNSTRRFLCHTPYHVPENSFGNRFMSNQRKLESEQEGVAAYNTGQYEVDLNPETQESQIPYFPSKNSLFLMDLGESRSRYESWINAGPYKFLKSDFRYISSAVASIISNSYGKELINNDGLIIKIGDIVNSLDRLFNFSVTGRVMSNEKNFSCSTVSGGRNDYFLFKNDSEFNLTVTEFNLNLKDENLEALDPFLKLIPLPTELIEKSQDIIGGIDFLNHLEENINADLKTEFFQKFIDLFHSLGGGCYKSWRSMVCRVYQEKSALIMHNFPIHLYDKKKYIGNYVRLITENRAKTCIKEIMKRFLFCVPFLEKNQESLIFMARVELGLYFNKYSDYFLSLLRDHTSNLQNDFLVTYEDWKRLNRVCLTEILLKNSHLMNEIVMIDRINIAPKLSKISRGKMKKINRLSILENGAVFNMISRMAVSLENGSFFDTAARQFYDEMIQSTKNHYLPV